MRFEEAMELAERGELVSRPGYGTRFVAVRDGQTRYGGFVGETGFADMRAYAFTEEDIRATDWRRFTRVLPDAWEGCDTPSTGRG